MTDKGMAALNEEYEMYNWRCYLKKEKKHKNTINHMTNFSGLSMCNWKYIALKKTYIRCFRLHNTAGLVCDNICDKQ